MLEQATYSPTLHARIAEIKALRNLSQQAKARLFPIIVWRPWPNAKALARTGEKVIEAFPASPFAVDLDRTKFRASSYEAGEQFDGLFASAGGYAAYYKFVGDLPGAVPLLRPDLVNLSEQLSLIEHLDRGAAVRIEYGQSTDAFEVAKIAVAETADVAIAIDVGWGRDLLSREQWASSIVGQLTEIRPEIELIISGSSFPSTFAGIKGRGEISLEERHLFGALTRRHNAANLIYGDWGSTRPPSVDSGPMKNVPRIDLPFLSEWVCFRREVDEGYADLARQALADLSWPADLSTWGTYMIESTAENVPGGIASPGTAAAARINIHMHRQALANADVAPSDFEEPYVDIV